MQSVLEQWRSQILSAAHQETALTIRGSGSKDFYGEAVAEHTVLDTRAYCGVVAYDPAELVLTVRCGTPLTEVEAVLAEHNQILPFEPPHFGADATIGGCVAAGLSGPRRAFAGAVKDFILGAKLMNGKGEWLNFGGQVMKNVAGYDVSRLLAGSLGTLGVIGEISFKVLPRSVAEASVRFEMDESAARRQMNGWMGQPLPLSASFWHDGVLSVRLNGAQAGVAAALQRIGGEKLDESEAAAFWTAVREQTLPVFAPSENRRLWRISLPDTAPNLDLGVMPAVEWGGAQRWYACGLDAKEIREKTAALGGHAALFRGTAQPHESVFHPLPHAVLAIQQRLKQSFDPYRVFNPRRLYREI